MNASRKIKQMAGDYAPGEGDDLQPRRRVLKGRLSAQALLTDEDYKDSFKVAMEIGELGGKMLDLAINLQNGTANIPGTP